METNGKQAKKDHNALFTTIGEQIAAAVANALKAASAVTSPIRVPAGIEVNAMEEASPLSMPQAAGKRSEMEEEEDTSPARAKPKKRDMKPTPQQGKNPHTEPTIADTTEDQHNANERATNMDEDPRPTSAPNKHTTPTSHQNKSPNTETTAADTEHETDAKLWDSSLEETTESPSQKEMNARLKRDKDVSEMNQQEREYFFQHHPNELDMDMGEDGGEQDPGDTPPAWMNMETWDYDRFHPGERGLPVASSDDDEEQWRAIERGRAAAARQQSPQQANANDIAAARSAMQEREPLVEQLSDGENSVDRAELITQEQEVDRSKELEIRSGQNEELHPKNRREHPPNLGIALYAEFPSPMRQGPPSPTKKPQIEDEDSWTAEDIAESAKSLLDNLQEASGAAQAPRSPRKNA
jgi:hypothetical protein